MDCRQIETGQIAELYVANVLPEADCDAYEDHYFGCERCFRELELLRAIQGGLRKQRGDIQRQVQSASRFRFGWIAVAAGLVAVVGGIAILRSQRSSQEVGRAIPVAPFQNDALYAQLARITPPRYEAATRRGSANQAERQFQSAMAKYQTGDYASAMTGLREPAAAGYLPALFFLSASELLTGDPDGAIRDLRRVVENSDTTFQEEGRFLLGKALLAKRDIAAAKAELDTVVAMRGDFAAQSKDVLRALDASHSPTGTKLPQ